jgi:hypothetical protein
MKRREFITLLGGAAARDGLRGNALYWTCSGWLSFQSRPGGGASGREPTISSAPSLPGSIRA